MTDKSIKRGGSASAREAGLVGIVVHVKPEEHARLKEAAAREGVPLKEFCRRAAMDAAREG